MNEPVEDNNSSNATMADTPSTSNEPSVVSPSTSASKVASSSLDAVDSTLSTTSATATATATSTTTSTSTSKRREPTLPSSFVYQLILEQFWGDGVSKREIRSVYTTLEDANTACQEYLLQTWTKDQFNFFNITPTESDSKLIKVSAEIQGGERFHTWIEKQPWVGELELPIIGSVTGTGGLIKSKKNSGTSRGPNAYIVQRTIKDALGGKRRSTTRGIFATRQLAKEALSTDQPPQEWESNEGYILEPGGEYAHATSKDGKTAWLFIEVRPLFMVYVKMDEQPQHQHHHHHHHHQGRSPLATGTSITAESFRQEMETDDDQSLLSVDATAAATRTNKKKSKVVEPLTVGASALNPISLDGEQPSPLTEDSPSLSTPHLHHQYHDHHHHEQMGTSTSSQQLSPLPPLSPLPLLSPSVLPPCIYLVLQLRTLPYTPPILTVEGVAYDVDVANQFGLSLMDTFCGLESSDYVYDPILREDGCLQVSSELAPDSVHIKDEGLTVWVERRGVLIRGDDHVDSSVTSSSLDSYHHHHGEGVPATIPTASGTPPLRPLTTTTTTTGVSGHPMMVSTSSTSILSTTSSSSSSRKSHHHHHHHHHQHHSPTRTEEPIHYQPHHHLYGPRGLLPGQAQYQQRSVSVGSGSSMSPSPAPLPVTNVMVPKEEHEGEEEADCEMIESPTSPGGGLKKRLEPEGGFEPLGPEELETMEQNQETNVVEGNDGSDVVNSHGPKKRI